MDIEALDPEVLAAERAELVKDLSKASKYRKNAEEKAEEWRGRADELILQGDALGIPRATLATAAGLTRQTVYLVLAKAGR